MSSELHLSVRFAILQMLVILFGAYSISAYLDALGYPERDLRWNFLPVLIRNYGFLLLSVPVIWTGWVIYM